MSFIEQIVVVACALFAIAATAGALEIQVSPTGGDAADGTRDHPFRTVGRAKAEGARAIAAAVGPEGREGR